jgi:magnesium transporter
MVPLQTLLLIAMSIFVLIGGVVLLTIKKPEPKVVKSSKLGAVPRERRKGGAKGSEGEALAGDEESANQAMDTVVWGIGEDEEEDEDSSAAVIPGPKVGARPSVDRRRTSVHVSDDEDGDDERGHLVSNAAMPGQGVEGEGDDDEFGPWEEAESGRHMPLRTR